MPVTNTPAANGTVLYQRAQYAKGGIGRMYWDHRDQTILDAVQADAHTVLDIGCGEGITLERLQKRFGEHDVRGLDSLDENVQICRSLDLPAEVGDVLALNRPDATIDCCILSEVIEHLDDHRKALLEICRILRPGGRLILVFPNDLVFFAARLLTFKVQEAFYDPGHVRRWTPRAMTRTLNETGFRVRSLRNLPFVLWPLSLHCVIVAEKVEAAK